MTNDIALAIMNNGILLLAMGLLYNYLPLDKTKNKWHHSVLVGALLSGIVLLVMVTTFPIDEEGGIVLDTRSILISISTFFFGIIPGVMVSTTAVIYRLFLGGDGQTVGILIIIASFIIGYLFRKRFFFRYQDDKYKRTLLLFCLGLITHIIFLLLFLLLPTDDKVSIIKTIAPYVLIIYPIIGVGYGMMMFQRHDRLQKHIKQMNYLEQFQKAIKHAPIPMAIHEADGSFITFSEAWLHISGYKEEEINTLDKWSQKVSKNREFSKVIQDLYQQAFSDEPYYEGEYLIQAKDGKELIWDFYSSKIGSFDNGGPTVLTIGNNVTERKKLEEKLQYLSFKDSLTDLYNRRFYEEEISRLNTKRNYPLTILLGDVNHLKEINDNYGHINGDHLLKSVAKAMKKVSREDDIIARMGGDEFIMILPKTSKEDTNKIISRLQNTLSEITIKGHKISVSFGQSTLDKDHTNVEQAFIAAENEMYKHKQENR